MFLLTSPFVKFSLLPAFPFSWGLFCSPLLIPSPEKSIAGPKPLIFSVCGLSMGISRILLSDWDCPVVGCSLLWQARKLKNLGSALKG